MGDEFYCVIKLVSGEEIFSLVAKDENDGDPVLILQTPVTIKMINSSNGSIIKVKPWMELTSDDFFIVKPDKIITITEISDENLINIYERYLRDSENEDIYEDLYSKNTTGKVKPSEKMGYISSVKDARKKLEKIFKLEVEDSKES